MHPQYERPCFANQYLAEHIGLLRSSFRLLKGNDLLPAHLTALDAAKYAYEAPFVLLSHHTGDDPVFTYGNLTAQSLFELTWDELTNLPSRFSAELPNREERARLLHLVSTQGFIDHYTGVRISKSGKRFLIRNAVVWNLIDPSGKKRGQAATFNEWEPCD